MVRRKISDEDRALWSKVVADASPLQKKSHRKKASKSSTVVSDPIAAPLDRPLTSFPIPHFPNRKGVGTTRVDLADHAPRSMGKPEPGLDRRTAERVRKGERAPDARIDLHGMTADRAHRMLDAFIARAIMQGHRFVLVITGKGGRHRAEDAPFMRADQGVLRQAVPRWLRNGPRAGHILGIYEAHQRHGGAGAIYVYLRKPRSTFQ